MSLSSGPISDPDSELDSDEDEQPPPKLRRQEKFEKTDDKRDTKPVQKKQNIRVSNEGAQAVPSTSRNIRAQEASTSGVRSRQPQTFKRPRKVINNIAQGKDRQ